MWPRLLTPVVMKTTLDSCLYNTADQNPVIVLVRGSCCLATGIELLCVLLNSCKVLFFILSIKKINQKKEGETTIRNKVGKRSNLSSRCKVHDL